MKIDVGKILEEEILKVFSTLKSDGETTNANLDIRRDCENYIVVMMRGRVLFQGKLFDDKEAK